MRVSPAGVLQGQLVRGGSQQAVVAGQKQASMSASAPTAAPAQSVSSPSDSGKADSSLRKQSAMHSSLPTTLQPAEAPDPASTSSSVQADCTQCEAQAEQEAEEEQCSSKDAQEVEEEQCSSKDDRHGARDALEQLRDLEHGLITHLAQLLQRDFGTAKQYQTYLHKRVERCTEAHNAADWWLKDNMDALRVAKRICHEVKVTLEMVGKTGDYWTWLPRIRQHHDVTLLLLDAYLVGPTERPDLALAELLRRPALQVCMPFMSPGMSICCYAWEQTS